MKYWCDCSTTCCGDNSRCELDGYVLTKYLVYCSAYYRDYDGCLQQLHVDEEKSSPPGFKISKKRDVERATNVTLPIEKRVDECVPCTDQGRQWKGKQKCPTTQQQILGYYKNNGLTLCWIVYPHTQIIFKAECQGTNCCGDKTQCEPNGYTLTKYLVYCDALYTDNDGCLLGTEELSDTKPDGVDDSHFNEPTSEEDKRDTEDIDLIDRQVIMRCHPNSPYFAFKQDYLATTCSCRQFSC
ncbi:uncharacterized protein [Argopecten irradians]|uniref:uncharacterized protein n=1 Tax=Argopecten irradians TaxID=31199 RepID=UPI003720B039